MKCRTTKRHAHLVVASWEPMVEGVGVSQQVCGCIFQALSAAYAEHQRPSGSVEADDVRHSSYTEQVVMVAIRFCGG